MKSRPHTSQPLVVLANLKGGTGKTTLATNVALFLDALLVDLDPQGDAADWAARSGSIKARQPQGWEEALAVMQEGRRTGPVVVDCPPGEGPALRAALSVADVVVIPAKGSMQDLRAVGRMTELAADARAHGNPRLRVALVLNEARSNTSMAGVAEEAMNHVKGTTFLGRLGLRQAFIEAFATGRTITSGPAHQDLQRVLANLAHLVRR